MDAVTIFNDFVNLVDSDDLPIEADRRREAFHARSEP